MARILIVDDERNIRKVIANYLRKEGFTVETARNYEEAVDKTASVHFDLILTDMRLPGKSGLHLLKWCKREQPNLPVLVITAYGSIDNAVEVMKAGASNYLTKPVDMDEMLALIRHTMLRERPEDEKENTASDGACFGIIGSSPAIKEVIDTILVVAGSKANILISGASGTGKELVAQAIHKASGRRNKPFVALNCAAIPTDLIENELFGHEKGSFTGALSREIGKVELADSGTLFLDEIGEMAVPMQIKLLRFIQERVFFTIGGREQLHSDCRIIAATNRHLEDEVAAGTFREDLFYRLNVIQIKVPALRDRKVDIPLLASFFLERYAGENKKFIRGIEDQALEALMAYDWPGNIRELENIIERAVVLSRLETIVVADLPGKIKKYLLTVSDDDMVSQERDLHSLSDMSLAELERIAVLKALKAEKWNQTKAARRLGITRRQLRIRMEKYQLL